MPRLIMQQQNSSSPTGWLVGPSKKSELC